MDHRRRRRRDRGLPRPSRARRPRGGVVVIHHMPGYDRATKEIVRRFAELGYDAICPNLYWREAPGAAPDDAAATARANGGVPGRAAGRRRRRRGGVPARRCRRSQRQGRRDRLLLGRAAGRARGLQPRPRRRGRLLRRVRRRHAPGGLPAQGDEPRRRSCRACGPAAGAVRRRGLPPEPRAGRRAGRRSSPRTARRTSSTATTTPATRSSRSTGPPTGSRPRTTAGSGSRRSTARTWEAEACAPTPPCRPTLDGSAKGPGERLVPRHRRHGLLRPPGPRDGRAHAQHRLRRPGERARRRGSRSSSRRPRPAIWSPRSRPPWSPHPARSRPDPRAVRPPVGRLGHRSR